MQLLELQAKNNVVNKCERDSKKWSDWKMLEHLLLYRELVVAGMGCSHAPLLSRQAGEFHCSVLPLYMLHIATTYYNSVLATARNSSNFILVSQLD